MRDNLVQPQGSTAEIVNLNSIARSLNLPVEKITVLSVGLTTDLYSVAFYPETQKIWDITNVTGELISWENYSDGIIITTTIGNFQLMNYGVIENINNDFLTSEIGPSISFSRQSEESATLTLKSSGALLSQFFQNGQGLGPVTTYPFTREVGRLSDWDKSKFRELVIPLADDSDYHGSPRLSFKVNKNKKVEVWSIHPDGGRNASSYQDLLGIDDIVPYSKSQRYRYKLLDVDDLYENIILMRYNPSKFNNIYANFASYDSTTGYSTFNFFFYFSPSIANTLGLSTDGILYKKILEIVSKRYLNTYIILGSNKKYSVFKVNIIARTQATDTFVLRVMMNAEPDGTLLTGTSKFISGYYGQDGASPVSYDSVELVTTNEELSTGSNITAPYTIANGEVVHLNATGTVDVITDQSIDAGPYTLVDVITNVTLDTTSSPNKLVTESSKINAVNSNAFTTLCTRDNKFSQMTDKLTSAFYKSTSLIDLLGDYSSNQDFVYYTGHSQKFANHSDVDNEYVNG